jgi:hypothetical protein
VDAGRGESRFTAKGAKGAKKSGGKDFTAERAEKERECFYKPIFRWQNERKENIIA